ncbi:hypothetical protein CAT7_11710 [Carnobacterium sp. AT7]|nr:hypothetical protein CAT7_11710 [Carnobacterium sp. AT7]
MLAQAAMLVVFVPGEIISQGLHLIMERRQKKELRL